jgi:hypothetical protein
MKKNDNKFSEERLIEILNEMIIPKDNTRNFVVGQGCKTNGFITRDCFNLNICEDETCISCQSFAKTFHEHMQEHVKNLFKDEEE